MCEPQDMPVHRIFVLRKVYIHLGMHGVYVHLGMNRVCVLLSCLFPVEEGEADFFSQLICLGKEGIFDSIRSIYLPVPRILFVIPLCLSACLSLSLAHSSERSAETCFLYKNQSSLFFVPYPWG